MIRHLYLHIPFCHHICPYCAFYKHQPGKLASREFIDAILIEAEVRLGEGIEVAPQTVFFGGGTPSLLSPSHLERLCRGLGRVFDFSKVEEWTLETNPATFDESKARLMLDLGITRPSLGVQSFDGETLRALGRDHSGKEAIEAFEILRTAGFTNISLDLMFSIPGQSLAGWTADLRQAVDLGAEHVSCYNLTYEEDTDFMTRHLAGELDADECRDESFFYQALDFLESSGFRHYEISNYARPGRESIHNQAYWLGEDYLGLGPSAVSTIRGERWKTLADTARYIAALQKGHEVRTERETLSPRDRQIEAAALRLRTAEGLPTEMLAPSAAVEVLVSQGLIEEKDGHLRLTRKGKALADPLVVELI